MGIISQIGKMSDGCSPGNFDQNTVTPKSENCIDTVSECTLQLINDAENYFDGDRDIENIKIERGRNREIHVNHFEQSR